MKRKRHQSNVGRSLSLFFYHHLNEAKRAMAGIWFSPLTSLMTIAVIGISLAVPACFYLILKNAEHVSNEWQSGVQISLYLQKKTNETSALTLAERIKAMPEVAAVDYLSPDKALDEFNTLSGFSGAMSSLRENPLPSVLTVTPNPSYRSAQGAKELLGKLTAEPEVEQGKLDLQWLERLDGIVSMVRDSTRGVAVLLILGLVLTVANTMRLNVLGRRTEVEVMKLVGATDSFIYRPYLYLGFWYGLIGGLLAWWLCEVLMLWSDRAVAQLAELYGSAYQLLGLSAAEGFLLILASTVLSMLAAWGSVYRHIREIEPS